MEYVPMGRTGVQVSPLCLGAMNFGAWGNTDQDDCVRIIHTALDAGINFIDTADVYSAGESERIVGKALSGGRREDVVLATKAHGPMGEDPNRRGGARRWLVREVEESLRRLNTDHIDLYQIHRPDPDVHIDETLGALTDLVRAGKIRYAGCSTFPAHDIVESHWVAEQRGRERFISEQPPYSILTRAIEADLLPVAQKYGMAVLPWSPLSGGWLTGRYRRGQESAGTHREQWSGMLAGRFDLAAAENQPKLDAVEQLVDIAGQAGISLVELALAFVLRHPAVTSAIIGPRTEEHLRDQLGAAELRLDDETMDRIDAVVPPGTNVNPGDAGWTPAALSRPELRRRR